MKCFVKAIDGKEIEPIEYEIDRTFPNSDGASIFDQQKKIPNRDIRSHYIIGCGDINYDIDVMGWTNLSKENRDD